MINSAHAGLIALVLSIFPAHAQEQIATTDIVVAQSPQPYHCIELPHSECLKCVMARGFSRPEARNYCQMRR
jgi:hypothetical protein